MQIQSPRITRRDLQSAPGLPLSFIPGPAIMHATVKSWLATSKNQLRLLPATLARSFLLEPQQYDSRIFPQPGGPQKHLLVQLLPSLPTAFVPPSLPPPLVSLTRPTLPVPMPQVSASSTFSRNSLTLPVPGFPSALHLAVFCTSFFFLEAFIFFWLHQVFIAVHAFSLVVDTEGYSQAAAHGFLTTVISLGLRHRLGLLDSRVQARDSCDRKVWLFSVTWDLPGPRIKPMSSVLAGGIFTHGTTRVPVGFFIEMIYLFASMLVAHL